MAAQLRALQESTKEKRELSSVLSQHTRISFKTKVLIWQTIASMAGLLKILVTAKAVLMVDVLLQKLKEMLYHHLSHLLLVNTSAWQGLDLAVEAPNKWNRNNHMKNKNKNTCIVRQKVIMLPIMANYNQSLPQYTILNSNNRCNNK